MKTNVLSRFVIAFAVIALSALPALAQITVTGTVTDKTGEPLIGASVLVVGTQMVVLPTLMETLPSRMWQKEPLSEPAM